MAGSQRSNDGLPKSILKKTSSYSSNISVPVVSREERNRSLALHHANLIQRQKEAELSILEAIETLVDFPSNATTDPLHPAAKDVTELKQLIQAFQPSDLDSIIEERNIDGKCGYMLCPRPNKVERTNARYRILHGKGEEMRVVRREEMEKWCSDSCAKHALYLRVQLSDTPAWERSGANHSLDLYGEQNGQALRGADEVEKLSSGLRRLAIERGDNGVNSVVSKVDDLEVRENSGSGQTTPRAPQQDGRQYNAIDGYVPRLGKRDNYDEMDDIMDTI